MDVLWPLALYVALKYAAYSGWCALVAGFRASPWWRSAWALGLLRLLVGIAIGGSLTALGLHLRWAGSALPSFVALLLPVRWLEWSIAAHAAAWERPSLAGLLLGLPGRRAWQAGGIAVSFATDLLLVAAAGLVRGLVC